jgi:hypothetical protein
LCFFFRWDRPKTRKISCQKAAKIREKKRKKRKVACKKEEKVREKKKKKKKKKKKTNFHVFFFRKKNKMSTNENQKGAATAREQVTKIKNEGEVDTDGGVPASSSGAEESLSSGLKASDSSTDVNLTRMRFLLDNGAERGTEGEPPVVLDIKICGSEDAMPRTLISALHLHREKVFPIAVLQGTANADENDDGVTASSLGGGLTSSTTIAESARAERVRSRLESHLKGVLAERGDKRYFIRFTIEEVPLGYTVPRLSAPFSGCQGTILLYTSGDGVESWEVAEQFLDIYENGPRRRGFPCFVVDYEPPLEPDPEPETDGDESNKEAAVAGDADKDGADNDAAAADNDGPDAFSDDEAGDYSNEDGDSLGDFTDQDLSDSFDDEDDSEEDEETDDEGTDAIEEAKDRYKDDNFIEFVTLSRAPTAAEQIAQIHAVVGRIITKINDHYH